MDIPVSTILAREGRKLYRVTPDTSVADAVRVMNEGNVGAVAVMEGERLVGIFTERDVLRRVIDGGLDPDATPVSRVMTDQIVYVTPDTTVGDAMVVVNAKGCRHLPVMDGDRLLGVISSRDLINEVVSGQEHRISELVQYIYGDYGPGPVRTSSGMG
jgi:Predicted signal-transduction protein containing cAMP-binding and CBS domains